MLRSYSWVPAGLAAACALLLGAATASAGDAFVGPLHTVSTIASTVPANGDVNPYGIQVVPRSTGRLVAGQVLVSNFNNAANAQGTGTTIVEISPSGSVQTFASLDAGKLPGACPGGVGLTTALSVLRSGWVIVGSLPTSEGTSATAQAGCLIVLDSSGRAVETISGGPLNGPWDMATADDDHYPTLFVTNVLNGTVAASPNVVNHGTVVRIRLDVTRRHAPSVDSEQVVGDGFAERTDPAALVVGPTGVDLGRDGTLYVADTVGNRIVAIPRALDRERPTTGSTVSANGALNSPLGLAVAPGGHILTVNAADGNLVETTPRGVQVATRALDTTPAPPGPAGAGTLFGLAVAPHGRGVYFVDDGSNTLDLLG